LNAPQFHSFTVSQTGMGGGVRGIPGGWGVEAWGGGSKTGNKGPREQGKSEPKSRKRRRQGEGVGATTGGVGAGGMGGGVKAVISG
jgi:hypothetical protein